MGYVLTINQKPYALDTPKVMGILNLTSDSFFAGSRCLGLNSTNTTDNALHRVEEMLLEKVDILDIGAVSSRPGAEPLDAKEEWNRLKLPLQQIVKHFPNLPISIDTYRAEIAKACISEGAHIINDISGGSFDSNMLQTIGKLQVPYILMHIKNTPKDMQNEPVYDNITLDLIKFFSSRIEMAHIAGVKDIIIDPGFGFGKTVEHNYQLLAQLELFGTLECPILAGMSRKSMLWKPLKSVPEQMLNATTAVNMLALAKGALILRVHDVKQAVEAVSLFNLYSTY